MRIHNLYTDEHGESHFRDIEIEWVEKRHSSQLSKRFPATGIIFRRTGGDNDRDWHNAPRRQYIINLDAPAELTASDGETRIIGAGEARSAEIGAGKIAEREIGAGKIESAQIETSQVLRFPEHR